MARTAAFPATIIGVLCAAAFGGCTSAPREIEFVVPDGFKGPFLVIERVDGQPCVAHEGKLTITVPSSRIVAIQDDSAFYAWTQRSARYENGDRLAIDNEFDASLIALRGGGHSSGVRGDLVIPGHESYFVGTDEEFTKCDYSELERQIATPRSSP